MIFYIYFWTPSKLFLFRSCRAPRNYRQRWRPDITDANVAEYESPRGRREYEMLTRAQGTISRAISFGRIGIQNTYVIGKREVFCATCKNIVQADNFYRNISSDATLCASILAAELEKSGEVRKIIGVYEEFCQLSAQLAPCECVYRVSYGRLIMIECVAPLKQRVILAAFYALCPIFIFRTSTPWMNHWF